MRQVFYLHNHEEGGIRNNTQEFTSPVGHDMFWGEDLPDGRHPWMVEGTFLNLRIKFKAVSDVEWKFTFIKNGVATGLSVTVPVGTMDAVIDTTNTVSVSPGDSIAFRRDPTPGFSSKTSSIHPDFWASIEFDSANARESGYGTNGIGFFSNDGTFYHGFFGMGDGPQTILDQAYNLVGPPGELTGYAVHLDESPVSETGDATASCVYAIVIDGVVQNGSGGTADTRLTLTTGTTAEWEGTIPVTSGQLVAIQVTSSIEFGINDGIRTAIGTRFRATEDGQFWVGGSKAGSFPAGAAGYQDIISTPRRSQPWALTDVENKVQGAITSVELTGLWVRSVIAPGTGKSFDFEVYLNSLSAVGGPTLSLAGTNTVANTPNGTFTIALGDTASLFCTPINTPNSTSTANQWVFVGAQVPDDGGGPDDDDGTGGVPDVGNDGGRGVAADGCPTDFPTGTATARGCIPTFTNH